MCVFREERRELTCGSGVQNVPAGVPEPQRDPCSGTRVCGVVVLHRHLNADPPPEPDWRRQDDAYSNLPRWCRRILLRRGHPARMAPDQRGHNETEEEEGEEGGEARRLRQLPTHLIYHTQHRPTTSKQQLDELPAPQPARFIC